MVVGGAGEYRLDYAYQDRRLAVEVHGYAWPHTPEQLTRDLARHRRLTLEGWTVVTFTWADVVYGPDRVAADLAALLASPPIGPGTRADAAPDASSAVSVPSGILFTADTGQPCPVRRPNT